MPEEEQVQISGDLSSLEADLKKARQQLDDDERAIQEAEVAFSQIAREVKAGKRRAGEEDAALAAVLAAERRMQRNQKTYDRLESQVLTARRQQATRQTASSSQVRTSGGSIVEKQPSGKWESVYEDPYAKADRDFKMAQAGIRDALAQQRIDQAAARQMLLDEQKRIQAELAAELKREQLELTKRGQDLNFIGNLGQAGANNAMAALPYMVPKGTTANLNKAIASMGSGSSAPVQYDPIEPQPFPFGDPTNLANNIALRAAAQWSPLAREQLGLQPSQGFRAPAFNLASSMGAPPPTAGQIDADMERALQGRQQNAQSFANLPGFRAPTLAGR